MDTYSLYQLNLFIRRILALNFPETVWITGEIAQVGVSKGHYFVSLVQKEGDDIIAQAEAVLWQRQARQLERQLPIGPSGLLKVGMQVRMRVQVDFNERYGLKLIIDEVDPMHTLGQLELARQQTLEKLKSKGLIGRNGQLSLPPVIQRIALLSSENAAGLQDYLQHLEQNPYQYQYKNTLFPVAVQGQSVGSDIPKALRKIKRRAHEFDAVLIIRGGGSRLDLAAFDQYEVCEAVGNCPLPVLTGIGHDIDQTVIDQVANRALKTPTAVADFLIERNLHFENTLFQLSQLATQQIQYRLRQSTRQLDLLQQGLKLGTEQSLSTQQQRLEQMNRELPLLFQRTVQNAQRDLHQQEDLVKLLQPEATLQRGYSLTYFKGKPLQSATEIKAGAQIETILSKGKITSIVESITPEDSNKKKSHE